MICRLVLSFAFALPLAVSLGFVIAWKIDKLAVVGLDACAVDGRVAKRCGALAFAHGIALALVVSRRLL